MENTFDEQSNLDETYIFNFNKDPKKHGSKHFGLSESSKICSVSESGTNISNIFYDSEQDYIRVHMDTNFGFRFEFADIPRKYLLSDLVEAIFQDGHTGIVTFKIYDHAGFPLVPETHMGPLCNKDNLLALKLIADLDALELDRMTLGYREIPIRIGHSIKLHARKISSETSLFIGDSTLQVDINYEPCKIGIHWLRRRHHKPFLGGYRSKTTEQIFHHASAQTNPVKKPPPKVPIFSRETQTYQMRHCSQSTNNEMSTQFTKPGLFVSNCEVKLLTPGPYETADEYIARVLSKIIIIQKYIRRWLAKRYVDSLREIRNGVSEAEKHHEAAKQEARRIREKANLMCQLKPVRRSDFDRLFHSLERWRRDHEQQIAELNLEPAEHKTMLARLLDQQAELLTLIDEHQQEAYCRQRTTDQINLLRKAAETLRWTSVRTTHQIHVDTPETIRGKELAEMMCQLRQYVGGTGDGVDRLKILLELKQMMVKRSKKLFVCRELCNLIDRETELMIRGLSDDKLVGLRQRIVGRFFAYAKLPQENPQIAQHLKVPIGSKKEICDKLRGKIYYCPACARYLPNTAFLLSARSKQFGPCTGCRRLGNKATKRIDLGPYRRILVELRQSEIQLMNKAEKERKEAEKETELKLQEKGHCPTSENISTIYPKIYFYNPFPFLINQEDIKFMVERIWERRSVLSGCLNMDELTLVRWRINEPWAPWNTMLVTRDEAEAHTRLVNVKLENAYAEPMMNVVNQRQITALNFFPTLFSDGMTMVYELVNQKQRFDARTEESEEFKKEFRRLLPPLAPETPERNADERHEATFQPDYIILPAIKGEKRRSEIDWKYDKFK